MENEIVLGEWVIIDGDAGTECIPGKLFEDGYVKLVQSELEDKYKILSMTTEFEDYIDSYYIYSIEVMVGYGARLSMPGFLDCTNWTFHDSETEAMLYLEEMYEY
jgi:hypothetical protein